MARIDRLITPPGWIARARMYSLILEHGCLYLLNTGKAANPTQLFNPLESYRSRAEMMQSEYEPEILEKENLITTGRYEELIDNKYSFRFELGKVEEMKVEDSAWKGLHIFLKADGRKYRLIFERNRMEEVEKFVKAIR